MSARSQVIADVAYDRAVEAVREAGCCSVQIIQSKTATSYNGALDFIIRMQVEGLIGPCRDDGTHEIKT